VNIWLTDLLILVLVWLAIQITPCLEKTSKVIFVITVPNFHQIW